MDAFPQRAGNHRLLFSVHECFSSLQELLFSSSPLNKEINIDPQFLYHKKCGLKLIPAMWSKNRYEIRVGSRKSQVERLEDTIRIISARAATRQEIKDYEENAHNQIP
jgi:hypothetical protein